jgi:hypothetical protein
LIDLGFGISNAGAACTLDGYPTLTFSGKTGTIEALENHTGQGPAFKVAPAVMVVVGAGAGFVLQYYDVPVNGQTTCPTVTTIAVSLPGIPTPIVVNEELPLCGAEVNVSAIETPAQEHAQFAG